MKAGARRTCRQCGKSLIYAAEKDERITLACWVDAEPVSPLVPLERAPPNLTVWERHPRLGWICMGSRQRHGYPVHLEHKHTYTYE